MRDEDWSRGRRSGFNKKNIQEGVTAVQKELDDASTDEQAGNMEITLT